MMNTKIISFTGILTTLSIAHTSYAQQAEQHPNVIIILADDIGYTDLGCYGAKKIKTPAIDQLARQSIIFTNAGLHLIPLSICTSYRRVCMEKKCRNITGRCPIDN